MLLSMKMFRSVWFWVLFLFLGAASTWFTRVQFNRAFPILDQEIRMDREAAEHAAEMLAKGHNWGPGKEARSVASISSDSELTTFIELEAGGKERLTILLRDGIIAPYQWRVRFFKEKEATETSVQFRPDGRFLGFLEKLPESQAGAKLTSEEAYEVAKRGAAELGLDLGTWHREESKSRQCLSGRVDYTFTHERPQPLLGEGRDQLILVVRGDRFCGIQPMVRIPDDFTRRFDAMRASNKNLQLFSTVAMGLVLGLGCCFGGLLWLVSRGRVDWRGAAVGSGLFGVGAILQGLNQITQSWTAYDTALPVSDFLIRLAVGIAVSGVGIFGVLLVVLAAAEGLSRQAFPQHIRLWNVASPQAAGSA